MLQNLNNNIKGDYLEVGVWRGDVSIFIRAFLKAHNLNSKFFLADTFA